MAAGYCLPSLCTTMCVRHVVRLDHSGPWGDTERSVLRARSCPAPSTVTEPPTMWHTSSYRIDVDDSADLVTAGRYSIKKASRFHHI